MSHSNALSTCPGCDERGEAIRQQPNGDLVCQLCGRLVSSEEPAARPHA